MQFENQNDEIVDYDDEDDELAREIREAEAKIEALKAKKTTPTPPIEPIEVEFEGLWIFNFLKSENIILLSNRKSNDSG